MTLDLARITALADAATPEPWTVGRTLNLVVFWGPAIVCETPISIDDASFIAAARTAVPEMAKEIERLRADMESYREGARRTIKHNVDERIAALVEVERLRVVLEAIANDQMPYSHSLQKIAREALK